MSAMVTASPSPGHHLGGWHLGRDFDPTLARYAASLRAMSRFSNAGRSRRAPLPAGYDSRERGEANPMTGWHLTLLPVRAAEGYYCGPSVIFGGEHLPATG